MSINHFARKSLIVPASLLAGAFAWAQAAAPTEKQTSVTSTKPATSREASSGMASGRREEQSPKASGARVDQFGHASGKEAASSIPPTPTTDANAKSLGSAHATESATSKHVGGVKYEDRTAAPTTGSSGDASKIAIDEPGNQRATAATAKPAATANSK